MKILVINACPKPDSRSVTNLVLTNLMNGMIMGGADVDKVTLRYKRIELCRRCFRCWTRTPGRCAHNDDMTSELYERWLQSDLAVYATPLGAQRFVHASLLAFLCRTLPSVEPYLVLEGGKSYNPVLSRRTPDVAVLALSESSEVEAFNGVSDYFRGLYGDQLLAEIYRPEGGLLREPGAAREGVLEAAERAGWELAAQRRVSKETLDAIAGNSRLEL